MALLTHPLLQEYPHLEGPTQTPGPHSSAQLEQSQLQQFDWQTSHSLKCCLCGVGSLLTYSMHMKVRLFLVLPPDDVIGVNCFVPGVFAASIPLSGLGEGSPLTQVQLTVATPYSGFSGGKHSWSLSCTAMAVGGVEHALPSLTRWFTDEKGLYGVLCGMLCETARWVRSHVIYSMSRRITLPALPVVSLCCGRTWPHVVQSPSNVSLCSVFGADTSAALGSCGRRSSLCRRYRVCCVSRPFVTVHCSCSRWVTRHCTGPIHCHSSRRPFVVRTDTSG